MKLINLTDEQVEWLVTILECKTADRMSLDILVALDEWEKLPNGCYRPNPTPADAGEVDSHG